MVEASADPEVVTARILRETLEAQAQTVEEREDDRPAAAPVLASRPAATIAEVPAPGSAPEDPEVCARTAKIGALTALVLVFVLLWLRHRRRS